MRADASQDPRQGKSAQNDFHGLGISALRRQGDVGVGVHVVGASLGAGRPVVLVDGEGPGNGLGVSAKRGLSPGHSLFEPVLQVYRANLGAIPAAGAFFRLDVAGFLEDLDPEIPGFSGDFPDLRQGQKLDI